MLALFPTGTPNRLMMKGSSGKPSARISIWKRLHFWSPSICSLLWSSSQLGNSKSLTRWLLNELLAVQSSALHSQRKVKIWVFKLKTSRNLWQLFAGSAMPRPRLLILAQIHRLAWIALDQKKQQRRATKGCQSMVTSSVSLQFAATNHCWWFTWFAFNLSPRDWIGQTFARTSNSIA